MTPTAMDPSRARSTRPAAAPPRRLRPRRQRARLLGVDAARGVALLGMIAVHSLYESDAAGRPTWSFTIFGGRAAAACSRCWPGSASRSRPAAGGSASTAGPARWRRSASGRWPSARSGWRWATPTRPGVGHPAVLRGDVPAGDPAGVPADLVGRGRSAWSWPPRCPRSATSCCRSCRSRPTSNPAFAHLVERPGGLLTELSLTGEFPALTWLAYLCAGLVIGRLALTRTRVAAGLLATGIALAAAATVASSILLQPLRGPGGTSGPPSRTAG